MLVMPPNTGKPEMPPHISDASYGDSLPWAGKLWAKIVLQVVEWEYLENQKELGPSLKLSDCIGLNCSTRNRKADA